MKKSYKAVLTVISVIALVALAVFIFSKYQLTAFPTPNQYSSYQWDSSGTVLTYSGITTNGRYLGNELGSTQEFGGYSVHVCPPDGCIDVDRQNVVTGTDDDTFFTALVNSNTYTCNAIGTFSLCSENGQCFTTGNYNIQGVSLSYAGRFSGLNCYLNTTQINEQETVLQNQVAGQNLPSTYVLIKSGQVIFQHISITAQTVATSSNNNIVIQNISNAGPLNTSNLTTVYGLNNNCNDYQIQRAPANTEFSTQSQCLAYKQNISIAQNAPAVTSTNSVNQSNINNVSIFEIFLIVALAIVFIILLIVSYRRFIK